MRKMFVYSLVFIFLLLVACSSDDTLSTTKEEVDVDTSATDDLLKVGINDDPTTLDPFVYSTTVDRIMIKNIFNSLTHYDLDTLEIKNELAKNIDISEDGLTYSVELHDNVVFHNDEQMVADDVKYSLERAMEPEASRTATLLEHINNIEIID